ncbi:response regulator transcription factor [Neobacillus niacini]|uniref:response regulator transcription factor n=1 Tax=Neobacillus niacini TaxID=86668 RepID=UPI003000D968
MTVGEPGRVLIVDDEQLIRQGIKHYLNWEQEGFEIVGEASNGMEALELIEMKHPHIIITDIVMPIMDGEELTRIIKERYPQIEIIILSSFGEFDYVRSTFQSGVVDYILKPKLEAQSLLKALKAAADRIPTLQMMDKHVSVDLSVGQIIQKLISGYEVNYDVEKISKVFPYRKFCLLGVVLKSGETDLPKHIKGKIESEIGQEDYSFHYDRNIVLVNGDDFSDFTKFAKQLGESNGGYGFALSETFTHLSQLVVIYKESLVKLLNYRFYFSEQPLLMKQNLPNPEPVCEGFNLNWFTGEFKRKNFEGAFNYLKEHVTTLSSCYTLDVYEYKAFFGNIVFNITVLLGNMDYDVKELDHAKYSYFKSIEEAQNAKEVIDQLNKFITEAKQCIFSSQNHLDNQNMKKLLEFIKDHYAEPLTLTDVAKHFHFNPSYLSSYFSTHNGEGFIEYINRIRIEEASKFLVEGRATISEISGMVGYSDHSYFCKVFKKITGLSPSQYRRKQTTR